MELIGGGGSGQQRPPPQEGVGAVAHVPHSLLQLHRARLEAVSLARQHLGAGPTTICHQAHFYKQNNTRRAMELRATSGPRAMSLTHTLCAQAGHATWNAPPHHHRTRFRVFIGFRVSWRSARGESKSRLLTHHWPLRVIAERAITPITRTNAVTPS